MKHIFILILLITFSTQANAGWFSNIFKKKQKTNETVNVVVDGSGDVISVVLTGKEFVEHQNVENAELSRVACFESRKPTTGLSDSAQDLEQMRLALTSADCGMGYNDTLIAKEEGKTNRTKARWSATGGVIQKGLGTIGIVAGVNAIADVIETGFEAAGTDISLSGSSRLTSTGNIGEDNEFDQDTDIITETTTTTEIFEPEVLGEEPEPEL